MFWDVVKREVRLMCSRPVYVFGFVIIPVAIAVFFIAILHQGLPQRAPVGIVDLDQTPLSRTLTRNLNASELIAIDHNYNSYADAHDGVQRGDIMGFFVIPRNFERDAESSRGPQLTFYCNLTYYVPASLIFRSFKQTAVTASGQIVSKDLSAKGLPSGLTQTMLQPLVLDQQLLGNPWVSYEYYLGPSFIIGALGLMIVMMTVFSFSDEIKRGTSPQWYALAGNRLSRAIIGKLLPQTAIWIVVGAFCYALMFRYNHFPMNGSEGVMLLGLLLFILASQAFAVIIVSVVPNMRFALSTACLVSILTFSLAAFSFPIQAMYGAVAITSYILPVRYYFLIYLDQAILGSDIYYSRLWFVGLLCFIAAAVLFAPLMRRWIRKPVYVP